MAFENCLWISTKRRPRQLGEEIAAIPKSGTATKHKRPEGEILEELVSSIRSVEMRVRDVVDDDLPFRKRRRPRFHPMMIHEMMHKSSDGPNDPLNLLIAGSFLKDDAPWIYELALEAYRALRSGSRGDGQDAIRRFIEAIDTLQRGSFSEEFGIDRMALKIISFEMLHPFLELTYVSKAELKHDLKARKEANARVTE
jgi:hypothetical protein